MTVLVNDCCLSMAPPKDHAVGDFIDSCKIGIYMVHMLHVDGKLIKIIKEHMY